MENYIECAAALEVNGSAKESLARARKAIKNAKRRKELEKRGRYNWTPAEKREYDILTVTQDSRAEVSADCKSVSFK